MSTFVLLMFTRVPQIFIKSIIYRTLAQLFCKYPHQPPKKKQKTPISWPPVFIMLQYCLQPCFEGVFFVRGPLNESNKRTPVVPSVVAHLSAAIIAYHENQFGSSPQMTNTAISVQLLQRLSKLDRWIPFPVHWQIAISPLLGDCVFQTVSAPTVRLGPSKEIPLTSLTEAICPAHNKNTGSSDQEPLDTD